MSLSQVSTPLSKEQATALVDAVMENEELALTASAHEDQNGNWVFEATCDREPDLDDFERVALEVLGGAVRFEVERLDPDIDWVFRSLEGLKPVIAGGFYVHGGHHDGRPPAGAVPVQIEAAQAFGTGHHETTSGCLEALGLVLKRKKPGSMLDVGTGTGILAIAFAKKENRLAIASDIDPVSVRTARENARLNEVGALVYVVEAAGLHHALIHQNGPYDLVMANILARPLLALAPTIAPAVASGGTLILSGLLATQAARILAAYRAHGLVLSRRILKKEWATLILERD